MNEKKFDDKGAVYAKARPGYPASMFDYLRERKIIDSDFTAADIGSGTGIFTLQISNLVKTVYAVEPNPDMRTAAEKNFASFANIISVSATAENTAISDNSVELITVAQAFHWFDKAAFKAECKRILRPGGYVILVWNDRDVTADVIADNFAVNRRFCPNFKGSSNGFEFDKSSFEDFFEGEFAAVQFDNSLYYDRDTFVSRSLSSSYAPKPGDASYSEYVAEIGKVFDDHSKDGIVRYPYITRCYVGKVE